MKKITWYNNIYLSALRSAQIMSLFLVKDSVLGFAEFTHTGFAQKEMIKGYPGLYTYKLGSSLSKVWAPFDHPSLKKHIKGYIPFLFDFNYCRCMIEDYIFFYLFYFKG